MAIPRFWRRRRQEEEMAEELGHHVEARAADLRRQGLSEAEAWRRARLEFGSAERYKEECRASLGYRVWDEWRADLRYALRGMRRQPAFTLAAVLILGLATGVNTAFFTLFNTYALKPLAIRGAERHFDLSPLGDKNDEVAGWTRAEWAALQAGTSSVVEGLYASSTYAVQTVTPHSRAATVTTFSPNYFSLLGARVWRGRFPGAGEEERPFVVLSHMGWQKLFNGSEQALGAAIRIRTTTYTVVGVASPLFTGTEAAVPDLWAPQSFAEAIREFPGGPGVERRVSLSGMVRPGVAFSQVAEALSVTARRFDRAAAERVGRVDVQPRGTMMAQDDDMTPVSMVLFVIFLAVLLIACANLANLHLARASSRTAEIAMRLSLGASRGRIVRQLLTESLVLALAGSALGLALASLGLDSLQRYLWSSVASLGITVLPASIDWRVFLFAAALAVVAALAFGLMPSIEATAAASRRGNLAALTRVRPRRWRGALIAAQVAVSLMLLLFAGILVRNLQQSVDVGFRSDRVFYFGDGRPTRAALDRVRREPWVAAAAATGSIPLMDSGARAWVTVDGQAREARYRYVDEAFFDVLGVGVLHGRMHTRQEALVRAKVAVISAGTVRRLWPGVEPAAVLGRTFSIAREEDARVKGEYQVIGVTPDLTTGFVFTGHDKTAIYLAAAAGDAAVDSLMLRFHGTIAQARAGMLSLCLSDGLACEPMSLGEVEGLQMFPFRAAATIASALGLMALALTAVGLHGVVRYLVVQREREIGVRMALGAAPGRIVGWIVAESSRSVVVGLVLGLAGSLALSKLASSVILEMRMFDLVAYLAVPLLLALTAVGACAVPAWRASRVDAMKALRQE